MPKLRVNCFTISLDGFGAGPNQSSENPLGEGGPGLHRWMTETQTFRKMHGNDDGTTGVDDRFTARGFENVGAWILGRNMFGPVRGDWPDDNWKGWWGDNPPYHTPVFVLTKYPRASFSMYGGTTFHFVTDGFESALHQARASAGELDVRLGGGVATIRQYLSASLIDELHLAISPILLGRGEHLLEGLDLLSLGYTLSEHTATELATHVVLRRSDERL